MADIRAIPVWKKVRTAVPFLSAYAVRRDRTLNSAPAVAAGSQKVANDVSKTTSHSL
jgi:hypothetical protein